MTQLTSPFVDGKYGWNYGENGWNTGMDENLLKFSYLFDRNVSEIVSSLPSAVNGQSYFLTTDNRLYFAINTTYYSTPTPKWFIFTLRATGATYQFDGTALNIVQNTVELDNRLDSVELTLSTLGTAAFEATSAFATPAQLDIVSSQSQSYTDTVTSLRVLKTELSSTSNMALGVSLVGGATRRVANYAALRAYTGTDSAVLVSGRSVASDGLGGVFNLVSGDSTTADDDGIILVSSDSRRWKRNFTGLPYAAWFGVPSGLNFTVAPLTVNYATQVQNAVTVGCNLYGGVIFPEGHIRIDSSITFPNKAFDLIGNSGTRTEFYATVDGTKMFDFSSCNGPAKTITNIGFSKIGTGYANIIGIYTNNTNGLYIHNCWARGLQYGMRYHGSFINVHNSAFEYNYFGIYCDTSCTETCWTSLTFYKNEQVDVRLTGDNSTFTWFGGNGISTRIEGLRLDSCTNATVVGLKYNNTDNTSGFTPTICRITGVSNNNYIDVSTSGLGMVGVFLEGANVTENTIQVNLKNTAATGNRGIKSSSSLRNKITGKISGWEAGVENVGSTDIYDINVSSCSVGQTLNASNYSTWRVINNNNTTDVTSTSTTIIYLLDYLGSTSGLSSIPYLVSSKSFSVVVEVASIPNSLSWKIGDFAKNTRNPVVGQPKGWQRVTTGAGNVSGTDWISVGNL